MKLLGSHLVAKAQCVSWPPRYRHLDIACENTTQMRDVDTISNLWYIHMYGMYIYMVIHGILCWYYCIFMVYIWYIYDYIYMGEIIQIDERDFPGVMTIPNILSSITRELHQPTGRLNTTQMNKPLPQYVWNTQTKPWWKCIVKFIVKCIGSIHFRGPYFWVDIRDLGDGLLVWGFSSDWRFVEFGSAVLRQSHAKKIQTVGYSSMVLPKWVSNEPQSWSKYSSNYLYRYSWNYSASKHPMLAFDQCYGYCHMSGLKGEYNRKPMVFTLRYGSWVSQVWWQG